MVEKKIKDSLLIFINGAGADDIGRYIYNYLEFQLYSSYIYLDDLAFYYPDSILQTILEFFLENRIVIVCNSIYHYWMQVMEENNCTIDPRNIFYIEYANSENDLDTHKPLSYNNCSIFKIISKDKKYIHHAIEDYISYNILPENII